MDAFLSSFFPADNDNSTTTKETGVETETTTSKNTEGDGRGTASPDRLLLPPPPPPPPKPQSYSSDQCPSLADLSSSSSSSSSISFSSINVDSTAIDGSDASNSNISSLLASPDDFNGDYSLSVLLPKRYKNKIFEGCSSSSSISSSDDMGNNNNYHRHRHRHNFELTTIDESSSSPSPPSGSVNGDSNSGGDVLLVETESGQQQQQQHSDGIRSVFTQQEKVMNVFCSFVDQMHSNRSASHSSRKTNQKDLPSTVPCSANNDETPNELSSRVDGEEPITSLSGDVVTPKNNVVNKSKKKKKKKKNVKKEKKNRHVSPLDDSVDGDQPSQVPISNATGWVVHTESVKKKKKKKELKAASSISSSSPPLPSTHRVSSPSSKQSIRKSSSGDSNRLRDFSSSHKSVSFFPRVRIHRVPKRCHLSDELMDVIWYSSHDFRNFRRDCYDTMHRMMELDDTTVDPILDDAEDDRGYDFGGSTFSSTSSLPSIFFDEAGNEYCRRGLELRVGGQQDGRQRRKKKVRDIVAAQQTFEDVTGMETDSIFLSSLLRPHSKACVELAIKAAECDAEEACLIHFEGMNDQEKRKL